MKDCYSVIRRQILEDVLGEKVEEYENFNKLKMHLNKRQHRKLIPLWKFLLHLLNRDKKSSYIEWSAERPLEFRILDTNSVAELWGSMKNKTDMTYEKLGRAMRYYYGKSIIEKVNGKRYSYRFILSRRTKKYISQYVNIKGMKLEPICESPDSRCGSPDNSNSDSASISSVVGGSDEEAVPLSLYDTPSSPPTPTPIRKKRVPVRPTAKKHVPTTAVTAGQNPVVQKAKVCIIRRDNTIRSAFVPPNLQKRPELPMIKVEEDEDSYNIPEHNRNQVNDSSAFHRNQHNAMSSFNRNTFNNNIQPIEQRNQVYPADITFDTHAQQVKNFCDEYNANRNIKTEENSCNDNNNNLSGLYADRNHVRVEAPLTPLKRHSNDDNDVKLDTKRIRLSDYEYEDSDLSSITSSISSDDFEHLEYIDIDCLDTEYNESNIKQCDISPRKKNLIVDDEEDYKLHRQLDPFMGADFVRLTDVDRMTSFDAMFNDIFEECLF